MVLLISFGGPAFAVRKGLEHITFVSRCWDYNGSDSWWIPDPLAEAGWSHNECWVFFPKNFYKD